MSLQFTVAEFLHIVFPSTTTDLDDARTWAARNILDYHGLDVIAVTVDLAAQVRNADPHSNTFYIQSVAPTGNQRFHFLWRASEWRDSRECRRQLLARIAETTRAQRELEAEQERFRTKSQAELTYRKAFARWLDDFAVRVCDHAPGFKPAWFKQSCRTIATKLDYDPIAVRDWLYEALADEQIIKDLFTGYPERTPEQNSNNESATQESNQDGTCLDQQGEAPRPQPVDLCVEPREVDGDCLGTGREGGEADGGGDRACEEAVGTAPQADCEPPRSDDQQDNVDPEGTIGGVDGTDEVRLA